MDTKIYVVYGSTGEYSDRCEWPVCAYRAEDAAQAHVEKASAAARELFQRCENGELDRYDINPADYNPYDEKMMLDYTGTSYYYVTVELVG